jgi:hypothetical protein
MRTRECECGKRVQSRDLDISFCNDCLGEIRSAPLWCHANTAQAISTKVIADHAERVVRQAVLDGESDWHAAARGVTFLMRQHGRVLPPEKHSDAWLLYLGYAERVRRGELAAERVGASA